MNIITTILDIRVQTPGGGEPWYVLSPENMFLSVALLSPETIYSTHQIFANLQKFQRHLDTVYGGKVYYYVSILERDRYSKVFYLSRDNGNLRAFRRRYDRKRRGVWISAFTRQLYPRPCHLQFAR